VVRDHRVLIQHVLVENLAMKGVLKAENVHRVDFDVGELNVAAHYHRRVVIGSVGGNGELRVRDRCHGEYSCSYGCQYRRRTSTNNRNESAGSRRPSLVACAYSVFSLTTGSWARRIVGSGHRPASHVRQVVRQRMSCEEAPTYTW